MLVVGAVATLDLRWYEDRPLFGRRIIVTRAREQASGLVERLQALGAATVELPVIEIGEPADGGAALREAAGRVGDYDWVAFTSANAVARFFAALGDAGSRHAGARRPSGWRPSGPAPPRPWPPPASGPTSSPSGSWPSRCSTPSRPARAGCSCPGPPWPATPCPAGLAERGWTVDVVEAYRTAVGRPAPEALAAAASASAVTFTSSSTVTNYLAVAGDLPVPPVVACIGPITADTARAAGLTVDVVRRRAHDRRPRAGAGGRFRAGG